MSEFYESLRRLFSDAGYAFVEPPIVHPASVFVELAGEDLRRRLFLTSAADGTELALRPDYTIPVCLHHLATGAAKRRADYAYLGPVFRQRRDEAGEFLQAGIESLGRTDRVAADADALKLALDAVTLLGVKQAGRAHRRLGAVRRRARRARPQPAVATPAGAQASATAERLNGLIAHANGGTGAIVAARRPRARRRAPQGGRGAGRRRGLPPSAGARPKRSPTASSRSR